MVSRLRDNRAPADAGFTLVELMITVSILAILASIALPNYYNFVARSRQTEARITLSAMYLAEYAFNVDQDTFTTCLTDAGYVRPSTNTMFYAGGFVASSSTCGDGTQDCHLAIFNDPSIPGGTPCSSGAFPSGGFFLPDRGASGSPVTSAQFAANVTSSISKSAFQIAVAGQISVRDPALIDVWTIDEGKVIMNQKSGL
ncbi:MAG: prepilin-type N-terminal cleavage/methylation domain-containing protein [Bdellovibrionales bacterium]|nr:prepilin-type N-terminal cleavage/methylation domain-containing protein [Bdellovibrionales bacterium]